MGKKITWHSGTPSDPRAFWSCDKCGLLQEIDPPVGIPLQDSVNYEWSFKEIIEEQCDKCFCFGPPADDCPQHGKNK